MKIGMMDVDGHHWPNLALMKLSSYHRARGDTVEWWEGWTHYDRVYMSRVFDDTYTVDEPEPCNADEIVKGGTGYSLDNRLPDEIEHIMPDYGLYHWMPQNTAYGFLTRGCPRACPFCIVAAKEGRKSVRVSDLSEWWEGQRTIKLLDPNLLACPERGELLDQLAGSGAWVDFTQGLDVRLTDRDTINQLNRVKVERIHFAWDNPDEDLVRDFERYNEYGAIKDYRRKGVYVLTNYGSTMEQDLYRVYTLIELGYSPYVMIYDKPNAAQDLRRLQRWCNSNVMRKAEPDFARYRG